MKYGKKILAKTDVCLNGESCTVYCLDGGKYYDIHVISDSYIDEELNTLKLNEPKNCYNQIPDKKILTCWGIEFLLWDLFYGKDGKMHTFECALLESIKL